MAAELATGDMRAVLAERPERSVHMCVTSPPYWGLRKYAGAQDVEWSDGTAVARMTPVYRIVGKRPV